MVTGLREQKTSRNHHLMGSVGVQAGGGLIQEEHSGVGDQRNANVGSLGLQGTHDIFSLSKPVIEQVQKQCLHSLISMQVQTQPLPLSLVRQISHHTQVVAI